MPEPHVLDRPVWSALTTGWAPLAEGDVRAWRLTPDYGPFAAGAEHGSPAIAALIPDGGTVWTVEGEALAPPGTRAVRSAAVVQMVADRIVGNPPAFDHAVLGEADAGEMFDLAMLTEPGPFGRRTHRLGRFIGVRVGGQLIAMAGERMRLPGFAEVSGVCTHPDFRGRGYAGGLMRAVARRMLARGETPFLHAYAANSAAIALYGALGFRRRASLVATVLAKI